MRADTGRSGRGTRWVRALIVCAAFSAPVLPARGWAQGIDSIPVLERTTNRVSFLDRNGALVTFVGISGTPEVAARAPDGATWVGTTAPTQLLRISPVGGVTNTVPLPATPSGVAVNAAGQVFVALLETSEVRQFSAAGAFVSAFAVGAGPRGVAVDGAGRVWVANSLAGSVSRINSGLVFSFSVGGAPYGIALQPGGGVWVTDSIGGSVISLSGSGVVLGSVPLGPAPTGIAVDGASRLWVVSSASGTVWRLSAAAVLERSYATGGGNLRGVAIDGKGLAWVTAEGSGTVIRIDARLDQITSFPGFPGAASFGDGTGFAHALVVAPGGDVDADGLASGTEIANGCNPFSALLPELGSLSPAGGSVEGGQDLQIGGCGFLGLGAPGLTIGGTAASDVQVLGNFLLAATAPAGAVGGLADVVLQEAGSPVSTLGSAYRFARNPGQVWLRDASDWLRYPVRADGTRGTPTAPLTLSYAVAFVAVDVRGGPWFGEAGGGRVTRATSDGIVTDTWTLPEPVLGGLATEPGGTALVSAPGFDGLATRLYRLLPGLAAPEGPFTVPGGPTEIAVGPDAHIWVACASAQLVARLAPDGTVVATFPVAESPGALAADRRGRVWVALPGAGQLIRIDPELGIDRTVPVGSGVSHLAVRGDGRVWATVTPAGQLVRVDPNPGVVTATAPTGLDPRGLTIDGSGQLWVSHLTSGQVRRYNGSGAQTDLFTVGSGRAEVGDAAGFHAVFLHEATADHDGDGVCNGAEIQQGAEPFHASVVPTSTIYFDAIVPGADLMVGGTPFVVHGCGFGSGALGVLFGGVPAQDLLVLDDNNATGLVPVSPNLGNVDLVVSSGAGVVIVPNGFRYHTSPIEELACAQLGVPVVVDWIEPQEYDTVRILRDGLLLATVAPGLETYTDLTPTLGLVEYAAIGELQGEEAEPVTCAVEVELVPPQGLACAQTAGSVTLTWTAGDLYDSVIVRRDDAVIATLPGTQTAYADLLPPLGERLYTVQALRAGSESSAEPCTVTFEVLAPLDLLCVPSFGKVDLSWTAPMVYETIRVRRDGLLLAELAGTATTLSDTSMDEGPHDYELAGVVQGTESTPLECAVTVPVLPVVGLTCLPIVFDVIVTWVNGLGDYELLRITRNGIEIATLSGVASGYLDPRLPVGSYTYEVRAEKNGTLSDPEICQIDVLGPLFVRGDANGDTSIDVADPIFTLSYLLGGGATPTCLDAADTNDDGQINIADPIYILSYLFSAGPTPPSPFPLRGPDPTPDSLGCAVSLPP